MASQERISVHNLADLKNTSDDAIPNYLNSLKFKQDHSLADTRLALGYGAFILAAACFGWDYKFGFEDTKLYTGVAVGVYALLNAIMTYWITMVEKGIVYQATTPGGDKIAIITSTTKHAPVYNMTITTTPKGAKSPTSTVEIKRSFTEWFDSAGHFIALPFQTMLATAVPVIGQADPKRVASAATTAPAGTNGISADLLSGADSSVLDAYLASSEGQASASGTDAGKKAGKGRKKA